MTLSKLKTIFIATLSSITLATLSLNTSAFAEENPSNTSSPYQVTAEPKAGYATPGTILDKTHKRAYVAYRNYKIDPNSSTPGQNYISWVNIDTNQPTHEKYLLDTSLGEPYAFAINSNNSQLFVLHYKTQKLSIIDTNTMTSQKVLSKLPKYPEGMIYIPANQQLAVWDSKALYLVDPNNNKVEGPITVSKEKYPQIKGIVYDKDRNFLWISVAREGIITAYDLAGKSWLADVRIPITSYPKSSPLGGRVSALALDNKIGYLYALVTPTLNDKDWTKEKIVTINIKSAKANHIGNPIEIPLDTKALDYNPITHEIYALSHKANLLSVISPQTWKVTHQIDFSNSAGTNGANSLNLTVDQDNGTAYVTHPFANIDTMSIVQRSTTAPIPTITPLQPSPDETEPTPPAATKNWPGPAAPSPLSPATTATAVQAATFSWGWNEYRKAWHTSAYNPVQDDLEHNTYHWHNAQGWYDAKQKTGSLVWQSGLHAQHYPTLVPKLQTLLGNPAFTLHADGTASITMDVSWVDDKGQQPNPIFKRVEVLTFEKVKIEDKPINSSNTTTDNSTIQTHRVSISGIPVYDTRTYTDANGQIHQGAYPSDYINFFPESMRAWWYKTGASMDKDKAPLPVQITFTYQSSVSDNVAPIIPPPSTPKLIIIAKDTHAPITQAKPGEQIWAVGQHFQPNTPVAFTLHSKIISLGEIKADATGTAKILITIPNNTPLGIHTITATQDTHIISQTLLVTSNTNTTTSNTAKTSPPSNTLPKTGNDVLQLMAIMICFLLIGNLLISDRYRKAYISRK